jgi:hemolysin activation/secretion protein
MRKTIPLILTALCSTPVISADNAGVASPPSPTPNANRPKMPAFIPKKLPGFELPPIEKALLPQKNNSAFKMALKGVKFVGNTIISEDDLQKIAQSFIGKTVSVTELEDLRQQITQYYIQKGYVSSGATFVNPEKEFQDGMITLKITEGKLGEIRVKGTEWLNPSYVSDRLYRNNTEALDINQLRENFQLLLLDPLIERMNGNLIPGSERGSSILDVEVTRAKPYQLTLSADNYRPPSIGSNEGRLSGWVRNLTGFGDTVDGSVVYSQGALGGGAGFSIPINSYNTRFNFRFNINNAAIIEQTLKPLNIKSRYANYEFGITQPLIQTLNRNLNFGIVFNYKKNKTEILGQSFAFSEGANAKGITKDSVVRMSLDFTERLESQVFSARSTTSFGINAFAPTWYKGETRADGNFFAWLGQVQYAGQIFDTGANLILRGDVQYTDENLMPLERFALGGRYSVRGYRENELVRDKGYIVSAEVRYPLLKDEGERTFPGQLTIFPFMDYGAGWNIGDRQNINYLHSVGVGMEWQPFKGVTSEISYAHALNTATHKQNYDLQDSGVQWSVNISAF